ncbi:MAG: efflux RND transporter permease subunit [Kiritimatiellae bacterium]|jgi:multidrug efflux pump subunit AcrB|nr:efflux RND transporter permease subunit [Kiritimatiellia bacterium]
MLRQENFKGPIAWMAKNHVVANLLMLMLIVGGIISVMTIKQEVFPDFDLDMINVSVAYPGSSPEEIEEGIIQVVEENIRSINGIKKITSTAVEGRGSVQIELEASADAQQTYQDILQEVDRITTFPENSETPQVSLVVRKRRVLDIALYGDMPEYILREQAELIREEMLQEKNITQVELSGVRDYEIHISIPRAILQQYNLTLGEVASKIKQMATDLPGGSLKTESGEILLRMKEKRDFAEDFAQLPIITTEDGSILTLGDFATVEETFEDSDVVATYNGQIAVMIDVYRVGKQTPLQISSDARKVLKELRKTLPDGLNLAIRRDSSEIYKQRLHLLLKNGTIGICLVLLVLGIFLEGRLAFWIMMGIPISFLGGLAILPYTDSSINMISMFAFLIALGIVVDDAIVVGENVYSYIQKGNKFLDSAILGTREVAIPVIYSVLTNIVAFLPLMFLPGFIGKIWKVIPVVVGLVFSISLLECLFILPAHLARGKTERTNPVTRKFHAVQQRFSHWFTKKVRDVYGPTLNFLLKNRYIVVTCGVAILIILVGYVKSNRIGIVPMMSVDSDYAKVTIALPYGSPIDKTLKIQKQLIDTAQEVADENGGDMLLKGIYAVTGRTFRGSSGGHNSEIRAYLTDADTRPISTAEFTKKWQEKTGTIEGIDTILFESNAGGPGSGASLSIQLEHSNKEELDSACIELADALENYPNVSDIDNGITTGKVQFDFKMRQEGLALGLTASEVARQVRNAFYGSEAIKQQRGRNEITVRVKLPEEERITESDIYKFQVKTAAGIFVPIEDVATITYGRADSKISHTDGKRTSVVSANVTPSSKSEFILADILANTVPKLQEKYPGLTYGFTGMQADLRDGMSALLNGFIVAMLAIYLLLAIPFKNYAQPLIVMVSIPFGIGGAVLAHIIMGYPLSMMSFMGIVALSGVVVNDSLVLIDFTNTRHRQEGQNHHDAVHDAGIMRFRPVMLTTLTTFFGLAPMIFETSRQAKFMVPMAISLGFGIVFATFITLILVPCLYLIVEDLTSLMKAILGKTIKN